jgi:mono/diheme cytochrome c family protein
LSGFKLSTEKRRSSQILSLVVLFGLAACQNPSDDETASSTERGRLYAQTNCATCHAIGETGDSPYAPAPPFRSLSENYPIENLAEAFAEGIGVGHGGDVQMPEFVMSPDEIDDLLTYLATVQE